MGGSLLVRTTRERPGRVRSRFREADTEELPRVLLCSWRGIYRQIDGESRFARKAGSQLATSRPVIGCVRAPAFAVAPVRGGCSSSWIWREIEMG
jgi:hypothetical protein